MVDLKLSAFSDEYADGFAEQLSAMRDFGITHIELRHADKKNVSVLTADEVKEIKMMLDANGIGVSSIGSPLGKITLDGDMVRLADDVKNEVDNIEDKNKSSNNGDKKQ